MAAFRSLAVCVLPVLPVMHMAGGDNHIKPVRLSNLARQSVKPTEEETRHLRQCTECALGVGTFVRHSSIDKDIPSRSAGIMQQVETHLSEDLIWSAIKNQQPLDKNQIEHTRICRDCREAVQALVLEAEVQGLSFPDLCPTQ